MNGNPPNHLPEMDRDSCIDSTIASSDEILDALGDRYIREILGKLADDDLTGSEILSRVSFSKATVYRRLDKLEELNLVSTTLRIDPNGHHANVYTLECEEIEIDVCEGEISVNPVKIENNTSVRDPISGD